MRFVGVVLVLAIVIGAPLGYRYIAIEDYSGKPLPIAKDSCDLIRPLRSKAQVIARLGRQPDYKGMSHHLIADDAFGKVGLDREAWTWDENGCRLTVYFNRNGTVWDCDFVGPDNSRINE